MIISSFYGIMYRSFNANIAKKEVLQMSVRLSTFTELSVVQNDQNLAYDMLLVAAAARRISRDGGRALVVGGFVRDMLIGKIRGQHLNSKDIDVEVYGLTFDHLAEILQTFGEVLIVGQSFMVAKLVNPYTGSLIDFSIPRHDSKVGDGHRDFKVVGDPFMSVSDAARRRDLTINSVALDPLSGRILDPFGGVSDIRDGILRATDFELFADDPLRVLRIMQFAGRFDFTVDPKTVVLCQGLDLTTLSRERIGEEWLKLLLRSSRPSVGLSVARNLGILRQLHPQLEVLAGIPQNPVWHPEGDVWQHTMLSVDAAARIVREEQLDEDDAIVVMLAALCHDVGKAVTTERLEVRGEMRWTARGHAEKGVDLAHAFLNALKMPNDVVRQVLSIIRMHMYALENGSPTDAQVRRLSLKLAPTSIRLWDLVSRSDSNGHGGDFYTHTPSHNFYQRSLALQVSERPPVRFVTGKHLIELGLRPGKQLGQILERLYAAQLNGEFSDVQGGLEYYRQFVVE